MEKYNKQDPHYARCVMIEKEIQKMKTDIERYELALKAEIIRQDKLKVNRDAAIEEMRKAKEAASVKPDEKQAPKPVSKIKSKK